MIRLILSGGLGNQMFQYAAGKALSIHTHNKLSIDQQLLTKKTNATIRNYQLNIFTINAPIKTRPRDKWAIKAFQFLNRPNSVLASLFGIFRDEKAQLFDIRFNELSKNTALFGYFQNELYFQDIEDQIRHDFTFKKQLDSKNTEIANLIQSNNSVSIHIRRGDYLSTNSNLKVLDIEYYQKAIAHITEKIEDVHFFIFSDDINWVRQNLNIENHEYSIIDWNKRDESYIDMQLMSLCKHNIIANSSFSWWAAWLNKNNSKIVIAPNTWYKTDEPNNYPIGFIPQNWIII